MKKLALGFLGVSLTFAAIIAQANTAYTVTFHNPTNTGVNMTTNARVDNNATHITCSGNCNSLPPNGDVTYTISGDNNIWGTFTTTFTYVKASHNCFSGLQKTRIGYNEVSVYDLSLAPFWVNVGVQLPPGLYGNMSIVSECVH